MAKSFYFPSGLYGNPTILSVHVSSSRLLKFEKAFELLSLLKVITLNKQFFKQGSPRFGGHDGRS